MPLRVRSVVGLLPLAAVTTLGPETMARLPDFTARVALVHGQPAARRARSSSTWTSRRARGLADALDRRRGAAAPHPRARCSTRTEFLSAHGLRALSQFHEANPLARRRSTASTATLDYEPGESTTRPLRRQLELARPGLVPGQLPARRGAPRLPPLLRRRLHGRVPDRLGPRADARRRSPTSSPARLIGDLPRGRRTAGGRCSAATSCSSRPGLARPDPVPRVLPRRHRRRASAPRTRPAGPASSPT